MSNVFVIIKVCYVHNQWYDISCATLYNYIIRKNYQHAGQCTKKILYVPYLQRLILLSNVTDIKLHFLEK